jgi:hypothetical protein
MYGCQQLMLELEPEPADEALEELLSRVAEEQGAYDRQHGYHVGVARLGCFEPVDGESDDDQA